MRCIINAGPNGYDVVSDSMYVQHCMYSTPFSFPAAVYVVGNGIKWSLHGGTLRNLQDMYFILRNFKIGCRYFASYDNY